MKTIGLALAALCVLFTRSLGPDDGPPSVESLPPVVIATDPVAGSTDVSTDVTELHVTFSKPMTDESWSWSTAWKDSLPEIVGTPRYTEDRRTCILPVKLAPGRCYGSWLNSQKFGNFKDVDGRKAVPYLLVFETSTD